jgi:hypothetical protein
MSRLTLASIAFLVLVLGLSAWLLTRPRGPVDEDASAVPGADPREGMTFAEWSVRNDGILLADIDPGKGASTVPRRFLFAPVTRQADGTVLLGPERFFSWAAADRAASADALFALGFRVNTEGRTFVPPDDPLWSDPIPRVDGGTAQIVVLKAKGGKRARFERRRGDPRGAPYWNRRAIGFPSGDGHMVYVTPDAIVVPADPHE